MLDAIRHNATKEDKQHKKTFDLFSSTTPRTAEENKRRLDVLMKTNQCVIGMTITPALAEEMLARNGSNRPVNDANVKRWENAIRAGEWMLTGEPIIFSKDGVLLDGQHRLYGCIRAGVPFLCDVRFGVEPDAFRYMDTGKKRALADMLAIKGEGDVNNLAVALTRLTRYDSGRVISNSRDNEISPWEALDKLADHPGLPKSIPYARAAYKAIPQMRTGLGTFIHYVMARINREEADLLFDYLATGAGNHGKTSPMLKLREYMRLEKRRMTDPEVAAACFRCWNALRGQKVRNLKFYLDSSDEFPRAI